MIKHSKKGLIHLWGHKNAVAHVLSYFSKVTFFFVSYHRRDLISAKAFPNPPFKVNTHQVFNYQLTFSQVSLKIWSIKSKTHRATSFSNLTVITYHCADFLLSISCSQETFIVRWFKTFYVAFAWNWFCSTIICIEKEFLFLFH